jgi:hypothetical protein
MRHDDELEVREVRSDDPSLSQEANRLLTEELREAVGADRVRVPRGTPRKSERSHGGRGGLATELAANRILLAVTFLVMLVLGVVVALATGAWWAVVAACIVHAAGAFAVLTILGSAATQTEHVDPAVAARLADEGVPDPDAQLTDLVEEFAGASGDHGPAELVTTGANEQTADPAHNPASAAVQQRTVQTPAGGPTAPAGTGSAMDRVLVRGIVATLMVLAVIAGALSPVLGARFLIVPAVMLPLGLVWLVLQTRMGGEREERAGRAGATAAPEPAARARATAAILATVLLVAGFVLLMGLVGGFF